MKRIIQAVAILAAHVLAVLITVGIVRLGPRSLDEGGVTVMAIFAYGLPLVGAFVSYQHWPVRPAPRIGSRVVCYTTAVALAIFGHGFSLFTLQCTDVALTAHYRTIMQTRLGADTRFRDVRLGGFSCDYILFPYITVHGDVATEQDRKDLESLLWSVRAPVYRSTTMVSVGGQRPSFGESMRRARER